MSIAVKETRFGVVISPGFGMLSYASVVDVLKQMRDYLPPGALSWVTVGTTKGLIRAGNGLAVLPDLVVDDAGSFDFVVIIGAAHASASTNPPLESWLRERYSHGATVCGTGTGTWTLARAGLLIGRSCTIHWRDIEVFKEVYPDVEILDEMYVKDGRIITCSGARTASDMIYSVLVLRFGPRAVDQVREILFHERVVQPHEAQRPKQESLRALSPPVHLLLTELERKLDRQEPVSEICARLGLPRRPTEKAFRIHFGVTPKHHQMRLRVLRAADLLQKSALSVAQISEATGFSSPGALSTAFLKWTGYPPRVFRQRSHKSMAPKILRDLT